MKHRTKVQKISFNNCLILRKLRHIVSVIKLLNEQDAKN